MKKFDVIIALEGIAEARYKWNSAWLKFDSEVGYVIKRLLNEAAVNFMSAEEVARYSGLTVKRVRQLMRDNGLNPKTGKTLLAKQAAETLANNAALLGIEPHEMDLMSPLAYLPIGSDLKKFLETPAMQGVKDLPDWETILIDWLKGETDTLDFEGAKIPPLLRDLLDHYPFSLA